MRKDKLYGYINSPSDELESSQEKLIALKVDTDNIFYEKSRNNTKRQTLNALVDICNEGDTIVCISISEVANSIRHFVLFFDKLQKLNINIKFANDPLIDTSQENADFLIGILKTLYNFNSTLMRKNSIKHLNEVRKKGKILGRPKGLSPKSKALALQAYKLYYEDGLKADIITEQLNISRNTFYKYVKIIKEQKEQKS